MSQTLMSITNLHTQTITIYNNILVKGASYETPIEWAPMNGESTKIVQLLSTDQEYRHVAGQFAKSCSKKIIKV